MYSMLNNKYQVDQQQVRKECMDNKYRISVYYNKDKYVFKRLKRMNQPIENRNLFIIDCKITIVITKCWKIKW
jgi:hypothetical protein